GHVTAMPAAFPLAIVIVSGIVYHVAQKASGAARPWPMLAVAYGSAFALTLVLALASRDAAPWPAGRARPPGLLRGLAPFGAGAGFFFIYRSGWPLASASVIASAAVTATLVVVGILAFGEPLTGSRAAGLALAVVGSALIARG